MITLFDEEPQLHICINCDSEFNVRPITEEIEPVSFCPYCGFSMVDEDDDDDDDEDDS